MKRGIIIAATTGLAQNGGIFLRIHEKQGWPSAAPSGMMEPTSNYGDDTWPAYGRLKERKRLRTSHDESNEDSQYSDTRQPQQQQDQWPLASVDRAVPHRSPSSRLLLLLQLPAQATQHSHQPVAKAGPGAMQAIEHKAATPTWDPNAGMHTWHNHRAQQRASFRLAGANMSSKLQRKALLIAPFPAATTGSVTRATTAAATTPRISSPKGSKGYERNTG
jgi:hypothetical protein